jgi:hypothetical protein
MRQIGRLQLESITGAKTPAEQCEVLRQIGVLPIIRKDGSVCVFDDVLKEAMLIRGSERDDQQPNWHLLDQAISARTSRARRDPGPR